MKRLAREMQQEDPDAFKVRNDNPSQEFAVDLSDPCAIGRTSLMSEAEAASSISAKDDFGHPVQDIPLAETGAVVFLDFARSSLRLPFGGPSAPVGVFVREICRVISSVVCAPENSFQTYIGADQIRSLQISRLFWNSGLAAWTVSWVEQPQRPLPNSLWRDGLTRLRDRIQSCMAGELSLEDAVDSCVLVLDCDYPQIADEAWGGLTQLVFDSQDQDNYLASPLHREGATNILRIALPLIQERLANLPAEEIP